MAIQGVVAAAARERVRARVAIQGVVAVAADEAVVAVIACEIVTAAAARQRVVAIIPIDDVVAVATIENVIAGLAVEAIVTQATREGVARIRAGDPLVEGRSGDRVAGVGRRIAVGATVGAEIVRREARGRHTLELDEGLPGTGRPGTVPIHLNEGVGSTLHQPQMSGGERVLAARPARQVSGDVGEVEDVAAGSGGEVGDDVGLQGRGRIARVIALEPVDIPPGAPGQRIDAARAAATGIGDIFEGVVAVAAGEAVGPLVVAEVIVACVAGQRIVARATVEGVAAVAAGERVRSLVAS